jgi:hypothetical protein
MSIEKQIKTFLISQPEAKRNDMNELHELIMQIQPKNKLWFLDGKDEKGKVISNPNIGYGSYTIKYADGKTKEFFRIGLSTNTTGISIYIMGIGDKKYLTQKYGKEIGKAKITGYCVKLKAIKDVNIKVLEKIIRDRLEQNN